MCMYIHAYIYIYKSLKILFLEIFHRLHQNSQTIHGKKINDKPLISCVSYNLMSDRYPCNTFINNEPDKKKVKSCLMSHKLDQIYKPTHGVGSFLYFLRHPPETFRCQIGMISACSQILKDFIYFFIFREREK